jgi:hypothetical protein
VVGWLGLHARLVGAAVDITFSLMLNTTGG